MTPPAVHRQRLICRSVRGWVSVFGNSTAGELRGLGARHVASCADCQRFFNTGDALERSLQHDAARQMPAVPAGIEQRIICAVKLSRPELQPRQTRPVWLALAGATACIALAVFVFQRPGPMSHESTAAIPSVAASDDLWMVLKPSAEALLSGDPLQREVDGVVSDAQSAVRFLERNFLLAPPEPKARRG